MYILGISAFFHDSAACLIWNGKIVAAAQEERFSRIKQDHDFPVNSILYCLEEAKVEASEVGVIVFYEKPFLKFERLLETYFSFAPKGFISFSKSMPIWIRDKIFLKAHIVKHLQEMFGNGPDWNERLLFSDHHLSHAASAFYPSPFQKAAVLTIDGVGEWTTTSVAVGDGKELRIIKELKFPHSLGLLYSAFTYYTGFKVNSGEYKMMGLAPYGNPVYRDLIYEKLISVAKDGSFCLDMTYFGYGSGLKMTSKKFDRLFGGPPRKPEAEIEQRDMDLASSIQQVIEEIVLKMAKSIAKDTKCENLCLAGGVALNCVVNGALEKSKIFKNIWVQPAAGDAGGAIGAALAVWHLHFRRTRIASNKTDAMQGSYLGPSFSTGLVKSQLLACGANFKQMTESKLIDLVAKEIANGKAVGWMQGRMEFGPRALGNRSILADPRSTSMQKQLNLKIKFRESFRPFAPSVLEEDVRKWFELKVASPYMMLVSKIKENKRIAYTPEQKEMFGIGKLNIPNSIIPAVTHVDFSARVQSVSPKSNLKYHKLISAFKSITGCPILVNTSFNVRGEPIVCSPTDAFNCFMGTNLDILVVEDFFLRKEDQDPSLIKDYVDEYELD